MNQKIFGPHLTIDGKECNKEKLKDIKVIYKILNDLPKEIGMTKMTLPYVVEWKDTWNQNKDSTPGVSGFVMIAESHISIHTFPDQDYVFMDIFSCKPFDTEKAKNFINKQLGIKKCEINLVERGLDFPR